MTPAPLSALRAPLSPILAHLPLTLELARREIRDRYVGQVFGALWALAHPLIMIGAYVFVFAFVFRIRIGGTAALPHDYTAYLLAGLVPWMSMQESMSKATGVILANSNLVKQVVFPIEVLPVKGVVASVWTQAFMTLLLMGYTLWTSGFVPPTYALLPALLALQFLAACGISYLLSAISAYFRDVKDFLQVFFVTGVYFMPVFYLPDWVPAAARPLLHANPFSHMAWCYQDACYFGRIEHPSAWWVFGCGSVALFYAGHAVWRHLRPGFGSVL